MAMAMRPATVPRGDRLELHAPKLKQWGHNGYKKGSPQTSWSSSSSINGCMSKRDSAINGFWSKRNTAIKWM